MRAVLFLSFLFFSLSGCIGDSPEQTALDYLAAELPAQGVSGRILIMQAAVAMEQDLQSWPEVNHPIIGDAGTVPDGYGDRLRLLHALATAGAPEATWADLVDAAWEGHDGTQFGSSANIVDDALAVSALMAAGQNRTDPRIDGAVRMLRGAQAGDGGWRYDGASPGEPDETAWVVRALDHANALDDDGRMAVNAFLESRMAGDGSYDHGGTSNCQSSGLSLIAWRHVTGVVPDALLDHVLSCQNPDGGFPHIKGGPSQVWATAEILQGLAAAQ